MKCTICGHEDHAKPSGMHVPPRVNLLVGFEERHGLLGVQLMKMEDKLCIGCQSWAEEGATYGVDKKRQ